MDISIIVPVLNEAQQLNDLIEHLRALKLQGAEVIVVDGGSSDSSAGRLRDAGILVLDSDQGRAIQMNLGARTATKRTLLFLHADTRLPPNGIARVSACVREKPGWGRFNVDIRGRSYLLKIVGFSMNLRSRITGIATGDQAIFITRDLFLKVGGFPHQLLMEDIEISKRLKAYSSPHCLIDRVTTSGRRWEQHGVWRTILLMWKLRWLYWRGVEAEVLAQQYR